MNWWQDPLRKQAETLPSSLMTWTFRSIDHFAETTTTTTAACHGALLCDAVHQTWTVPSILTKESEIPSAWLGVHSLRRRQVRITEPHFRQHGFLISYAFEYEAGHGSSKRGLAPDRSEPQKCLKGWSECWATERLRENGAEC